MNATEYAAIDWTKRKRACVSVDFDGVLHSYESGWQGATVIPDAPVPGAFTWLSTLVESFDVFIVTTRLNHAGAKQAIRDWFITHGLPMSVLDRVDFAEGIKPPSIVMVDDRAFRFEGVFPSVGELRALKPWYKARVLPGEAQWDNESASPPERSEE